MMRAAWYERAGPPHEVLTVGEMPEPTPGDGEVLVRVAASGINPHDTKKRAGWLGRPLPAARVVPHADGAGVVAAAGPGVDPACIGKRVWFFRADDARPGARPGQGSACDAVVLPAAHAVPLPEGVSFETGACLGVPALTAYAAVFRDGAVAGQAVLVQGGAGAVGGYAVQMARLAGARVIATASTREKAARARALGAEAVIDYRSPDAIAQILEATGGGADRIIEVDFGANIALDVAVIREHGVIASYSSTRVREPVLPYYPLAFKAVTVHFVQGMLLRETERAAASAHVGGLLEQGALLHPEVRRFPLDRIADAHAAAEAGFAGKVVVIPGKGG